MNSTWYGVIQRVDARRLRGTTRLSDRDLAYYVLVFSRPEPTGKSSLSLFSTRVVRILVMQSIILGRAPFFLLLKLEQERG